MAERVSAHEARNQARKLTKEEKKEKKKKKFEKDLKLGGTYVALFRFFFFLLFIIIKNFFLELLIYQIQNIDLRQMPMLETFN